MASIREIAKKANVAPGTVSRALNNKGYISKSTREKIEKALLELEYVPNELARNLFRNRSNMVGVILPDIEHPFFMSVIMHMVKILSAHQYHVVLWPTGYDPQMELNFLDIRDARDIFDTAAKTRIREAEERGGDLTELLDDLREHGRDHARTPFQWDSAPHAGFSQTEPWIPVHPDYPSVNVRLQRGDPSSVLCWYKQLIALRRGEYKELLVYGDFIPFAVKEDCAVAYGRSFKDRTLVVLSLFSETGRILDLPLPIKKIILSNDEMELMDGRISLKGYQTVLYEAKTSGKGNDDETGNDLL